MNSLYTLLTSKPRLQAFALCAASLSFAISLGIVAEDRLVKHGVSLTGLGPYVTAGIIAVSADALIKLHIVLGWIARIPTEVSTRDEVFRAHEYLTQLEEASNSSNKTFSAQIKAAGMVLLAATYLITTKNPELANALTIPFADKYPLVTLSTVVTVAILFTNSRTVWYLIGDGFIKRIVRVFGFLNFAFVSGGVVGFLLISAVGIVIDRCGDEDASNPGASAPSLAQESAPPPWDQTSVPTTTPDSPKNDHHLTPGDWFKEAVSEGSNE